MMRNTLARAFFCFVIVDAAASRRELHLDEAVRNDKLGFLHNLLNPVPRFPKPPPLPENPVPLSAAVFDPMTEAWYTTEFEPFGDSDIDNTVNIGNFSTSILEHMNATSMLENSPLSHHLPMLAKVVSALFRAQDDVQEPKQEKRRHEERKGHGYLMKPTEHSDTMPIRRTSSNVPSEDTPSVPFFDQDIDPSPSADIDQSPSASIKSSQEYPQGALFYAHRHCFTGPILYLLASGANSC